MIKVSMVHGQCPTCSCERRAKVDADLYRGFGSIAWSEHVEAHTEKLRVLVARGYPWRPTADDIERSGGFRWGELVRLLGRQPTTWEARPALAALDAGVTREP
jgi:hypothetical protein